LISGSQEFVENVRAERAGTLSTLREEVESAASRLERQRTAVEEANRKIDALRMQMEAQLDELRTEMQSIRSGRPPAAPSRNEERRTE
jgi:hypothetical protein